MMLIMFRRCLVVLVFVSVLLWLFIFLHQSSFIPMHSVKTIDELLSNNQPAKQNYKLLFLYNRIPKTGSTSFMSLLYNLHTVNGFSLTFVNVSTQSHIFTFVDQYRFAKNISLWKKFHPGIFHGHFPFVNFRQLGFQSPIYINIVREPLERLVSHYYFVRYGDTFLPNKKRTYQGDTTTLDQCVKDKSSKCDIKKLWLQIPYFCGVEPECWDPGNKQALRKAKANVINNYFLVGITEKMDLFIDLLETVMPEMFKGTSQLYNSDGNVHIRKTKYKKPLEEETIAYFKTNQIYKLESEFYEFVKKRFLRIYEQSKQSKDKYQVSYQKLKFQNDS